MRRRFTEEELADPIAALKTWRYDGRHPLSPADPAFWVERLEARYAVRIPDDFRRYLLHVAPGENVMDDQLTNWFSLAAVRSIPDELRQFGTGSHTPSTHPAIAAEEESYLVFADYMIWCWGWAVCCSDGPNRGRVAMVGGDDGFVADSFTEFAERYLRDPVDMANTFPPPWREKGATVH